MYQFRVSSEAENQFMNLANKTAIPGVIKAIEEISKNPYGFKQLRKTGKKVLGEYYIKVNWYSVLLNIDDSAETVDILNIIPHAYLHRLLKI